MISDEDNKKTVRSSVHYPAFLKDVLICSLGAYGGPEAHLGVFLDRMVTKKRYLNEQDFVELMALCSILPGPTSTRRSFPSDTGWGAESWPC
jgi:chromate transporter